MRLTWQDFLEFLFPSSRKCPFCQENYLQVKQEICSFCYNKINFLSPKDGWQEAALGVYESVLQEAVASLKYRHGQKLAEPLGRMLANHIRGKMGLVDSIVPIPLHENRLRKRGFNQAILLARVIGEELKIPVIENGLIRKRDTTSQVGLSRNQRLNNILGAFFVPNREIIQGKRIILLDDVYTTGATAKEAQTTIYLAGAIEVKILTIARGI